MNGGLIHNKKFNLLAFLSMGCTLQIYTPHFYVI